MGGAVRGLFLSAFDLPKSVYIATAGIIALFIDITRVTGYYVEGARLESKILWGMLIFIPASFLGAKAAKSKTFSKSNCHIFIFGSSQTSFVPDLVYFKKPTPAARAIKIVPCTRFLFPVDNRGVFGLQIPAIACNIKGKKTTLKL
jgi:hypothetical protein